MLANRACTSLLSLYNCVRNISAFWSTVRALLEEMVAVATTALLEGGEDVNASVIQLFFCRQNWEMCPFWSHQKHFPSLIHLVFLSSVMVACALVRPRSMAFGSQCWVRALVHCSQVPPITFLPLSLLLSWIYSSCRVSPHCPIVWVIKFDTIPYQIIRESTLK